MSTDPGRTDLAAAAARTEVTLRSVVDEIQTMREKIRAGHITLEGVGADLEDIARNLERVLARVRALVAEHAKEAQDDSRRMATILLAAVDNAIGDAR